jgi:hypothetical protein
MSPASHRGGQGSPGHVGFVVNKVALGQVFPEYFSFPCQFSFHLLLHTHHLSSDAGTVGQLMVDVPSGLSLTPPQETKKYSWTLQVFITVALIHTPYSSLEHTLKSSQPALSLPVFC